MDFAYIDKLTKDNNGVKYLLVGQDVFDRTIDVKGMKRSCSKTTARALLTMITKNNWPEKFWVDNGRKFAEHSKKVCRAEGFQIHSRMSETTAAFAERTKRSLMTILYRYMEDYGY